MLILLYQQKYSATQVWLVKSVQMLQNKQGLLLGVSMDFFQMFDRAAHDLPSEQRFLTLIEYAVAGSVSDPATLDLRRVGVADKLGLSPLFERASRQLLQVEREERFTVLCALLDQQPTGYRNDFWMNGAACDRLLDLAEGCRNVRFGYSHAFRPCLSYAHALKSKEIPAHLTFSSPNSNDIDLMGRMLVVLGLADGVTLNLENIWHSSGNPPELEIILPPFGADMRGTQNVPRELAASLGISDEKSGRLSIENLSIAHVIEQSPARALIVSSDSAMFRTVGSEPIMRKSLLESGRLKGVMDIPAGMAFADSRVEGNLLVLDAPGQHHHTVRFVDLGHQDVAITGRRGRADIRNGVSWSHLLTCEPSGPGNLLRDVSHQEITENNFVLMPERYLNIGPRNRIDTLLSASDVAELSDLVEFVRPISLTDSDEPEFCLLECAPSDIGPRGFVTEPARKVWVDRAKYQRAISQQLQCDDLVLCVKGTIGSVGLVSQDAPGAGEREIWTAGQSMMILRRKPRSPISSLALYEYLSNATMQQFFRSLAGGVGILSIGMKDLKKLPVPIPDDATQVQIATAFENRMQVHDQIDALQAQLSDLRSAHWPHDVLG